MNMVRFYLKYSLLWITIFDIIQFFYIEEKIKVKELYDGWNYLTAVIMTNICMTYKTIQMGTLERPSCCYQALRACINCR